MSTKAIHDMYTKDLRSSDQNLKVIPLVKINVLELNEDEQKDLRIFYWAAFFGLKKYV